MKKLIVVLIVAAQILACESNSKKEEQWPDKMQNMANSLSDLMPYVFNEVEFNKESNREIITEKIKKFSKASHKINPELAKKMLGDDPLVIDSLTQLSQEIESAESSFAKNNTRYSRFLLQHSVQYCFSCHTRSQFGPQFKNWNLPVDAMAKMSPFQKAQVFVATRQFERAKDIIKSGLDEKSENQYQKEMLVKLYLAIAARGENNPKDGLSFIGQIKNRPDMPTYLKANLESWENSFKKWLSISVKDKSDTLKTAKDLVTKPELTAKPFDNEARYVDNLRASSLLHNILQQNSAATQMAESYYYLGLVYEDVTEIGFWELPEHYFAACIEKLPNSAWARRCFKRFEQNIILGFSGSSGTFIPTEEQKRLEDLKKKSGI